MAEMTLSLQVDLVLSDVALDLLANSVRHDLFNRCCHFAYGDAAIWLNCIWHSKNARFTYNFGMSVTPDMYRLQPERLKTHRYIRTARTLDRCQGGSKLIFIHK